MRSDGSCVHNHAGNIIVQMVLFVVEGGILMIRSYFFGCLVTILWDSSWSSLHRYSMCQLSTRSSWMITPQNSWKKAKKLLRHFCESADNAALFIISSFICYNSSVIFLPISSSCCISCADIDDRSIGLSKDRSISCFSI